MYSAPAGKPLSFLTALTRLVLRSKAFKAYLALAPVVASLCLLSHCRAYCYLALEIWPAPLAYIYVHETAQYLALGADVLLKLEGGYIVLEPLGKPKRPRAAVVAGALAPAALGALAAVTAPLFSAIILISVVLTLARYVEG